MEDEFEVQCPQCGWVRDNSVDINDPVAIARWYGVSIEEYLTGQGWADENLPSD